MARGGHTAQRWGHDTVPFVCDCGVKAPTFSWRMVDASVPSSHQLNLLLFCLQIAGWVQEANQAAVRGTDERLLVERLSGVNSGRPFASVGKRTPVP